MLIMITQLFCCTFMTGVIWIIQMLHYPSFRFVNGDQFNLFHQFHTTKISFIVMPVMVVELLTALLLVNIYSDKLVLWINLLLLIFIWLSTFILSVPAHNQLSEKREDQQINKLVKTNWIRTILWSLRSVLIAYILVNQIHSFD